MSSGGRYGVLVCSCQASRQMTACLWLHLCTYSPVICIRILVLSASAGKRSKSPKLRCKETRRPRAAFCSTPFPVLFATPLLLSVSAPLRLGWQRRLWMGRMGTTVTAGWLVEEQKDRAGDCARCLAAKRWAGMPWFPRRVLLQGQAAPGTGCCGRKT